MFACSGGDRARVAEPPSVSRVNLRLERIVITQAVQDDDGSLPMVAGSAAAVNVIVGRSSESTVEVPVVLRLFRGTTLVFADTTRTGGILGPLTQATPTSAQFLIPATLVSPDISWQVELDPAQTQPDSTRIDNLLPRSPPEVLKTVVMPPIRVRLVPIILARHGGTTGDVTPENAELYVRLARQIYPLGTVIVTVGTPLTSNANFGALPGSGGDVNFWWQVLSEMDAARGVVGPTDEYWYGVVQLPNEYTSPVFGGFGYIPSSPQNTRSGSRVSAGLGVSRNWGMAFAQEIYAHELGHNFGRLHAPGCGAIAPIDLEYRGLGGTISAVGHDVWSLANGVSRSAQSIGRETGDVMSYCSPKWIGPYTYSAVLTWRQVPPVLGRITSAATSIAVP